MTLKLNDTEQMILNEALQELRRVKMNALATVNVELGCNPRVRPFTKEDFGIDVIDSLTARIEALDEPCLHSRTSLVLGQVVCDDCHERLIDVAAYGRTA